MSKITPAHIQAARALKHLRMSRGKTVDAKTEAIAALDPHNLPKTPGLNRTTIREDLTKLANSPDLFMKGGSPGEKIYVESWRILEVLANHPEVK